MKYLIHKASERGGANFGWLNSKHSFSFGHFYDPQKMSFGLLRVLNDDIVQAGMGFGEHPHDNMEIVSIPTSGALEHKDSTGTNEVIRSGEVQIMSAGTGIRHSEYNHSKTEQVKFFQIWVMPKEKNIQPRYEQKKFEITDRENKFQIVVSPNKEEGGVWINQDAWFSLANISNGNSVNYQSKKSDNAAYLFVIKGSVEIANQILGERDAMGIVEYENIDIKASEDAEVLVIDVPLK
ncbi:MAG: pirin family protein [bacterium]|jgi:redox-sensitive bicupin YhaK (pirin superfamily)